MKSHTSAPHPRHARAAHAQRIVDEHEASRRLGLNFPVLVRHPDKHPVFESHSRACVIIAVITHHVCVCHAPNHHVIVVTKFVAASQVGHPIGRSALL
eukprot:3236488-Prymnesium_polylepis.1